MFCSKCGAENSGNNRFCEKCGAPLESNGAGSISNILNAASSASGKFDVKNPANATSLAGAVLMILSVFFPYVTVELFGFRESVTLINWDGHILFGAIIIAPAAAALACLLLGKSKLYKILAIVNAALALIELIYIDSTLKEGEGEYLMGSDYLHYGFGHILLIIAIIATIAAVALNWKKAN